MSTPSPSVDWKVEGRAGLHPCVCERELTPPCDTCGQSPCECPDEPCEVCGQWNCVCERRQKTRVKLSDGKARSIQHMMMTTFWHPDGTPMSCAQFMEILFGKLPEFFKDEDELRAFWSVPDTRSRLLENLTEAGFCPDQLAEMQRAIEAENCDLFDVLAYVAWTSPTVPRAERAAKARVHIHSSFTEKQQAFLEFVLAHYVAEGVSELDQKKLPPLLRLRYNNSMSDAVADLGKAEDISRIFAGFQQFLYQGGV